MLAVASAAAFAFIFGNEADELPVTDLATLLTALAGILAVQTALLLLIHRLFRLLGSTTKGLTAAKLIAGAFVASNAYFTAFNTYEAAFATQLALAGGFGAIILLLMFVGRWQPFSIFVLSAYFVMSLGLYAYTRNAMETGTYEAESVMPIRSQRNVYLIGNESLHSPGAYRDLYGATELPHVDYLRANGFRVLDRAYSADKQTLPSFSRILEFRRSLSERDIDHRIVFKSMNSTFRTFADSGYRLQFIYRSAYFGMKPELLDFHYPRSTYFQCGFVPTGFFYGLCTPAVKIRINRYIFGTPSTPDLELVARRLRVAARSDVPWLTIYHHSFPFHSELYHDFSDRNRVRRFEQRVRRALPRIQAKGMEPIVRTILREDPGAVVVLFGDHGAGITRGADLDGPNSEFTPSQVLEDRFGVMLAVYPRDFCANRIFEGSTTTFLMDSIIRCLNGDDSPTSQEIARSRTFFWEGPRSVDQPGARR